MATRFEVFDKLREFGRSLDKATNACKNLTEDDPQEINKAKACLQLRRVLAETKTFKGDAKRSIDDSKKRLSFDQFLAVCEKQAEKMKEEIENLEEYLAKYGYERQTEKLPTVQMECSEESDAAENSGQSSSGSPQSNSDKENQLSEPEQTVNNNNGMEESTLNGQAGEADFLSTPVRPTTAIKLIQDPAPLTDVIAISTDDSEPVPPPITTPMIKSRECSGGNSNFNTPDSITKPPVQPATRTPLIKADLSDQSPNTIPQMGDSLTDDFPTPPTFTTPGLQRYGSKKHGGVTLLKQNTIETPPPPTFSSFHLLNPDDRYPSSNPASHGFLPPQSISSHVKGMVALPDINQQAYLQLPECLQRQFSLEQVNYYIKKTDNFLNSKIRGKSGFVSDEELMSVLDLGPMTRAFILLMIKLNYFTIVKNGLYKVHM